MRSSGGSFALRTVLGAAVLCGARAGAQGATRFVRANAPANGDGLSWATAYRRVYEALDAAGANPAIDQVWVSAGTYTPNRSPNNRDDSFMLVSNLALYGGFNGTETSLTQRDPAANVTVLSGDIAGNDAPSFANRGENTRRVVRAIGVANARLDGFTIKGGNADFDGEELTGGPGAHFLLSSGSVLNCTFTDNVSGPESPDLACFGALFIQACPVVHVVDCEFRANRAMNGGAMAIWSEESDRTQHDTEVTITRCDFFDNFSPAQSGGAIWSATGDQLFLTTEGEILAESCRFINNSGEYYGAWLDQNTTRLTIESCEFFGNSSKVVGGAVGLIQTVGPDTPTPALIRRSVFDSNVCHGGGSAAIFEARNAVMDSCVVLRNVGPTALRAGPLIGIAGGSRSLDIRNSLIHSNTGTGIFGFQNPRLTVFNSTVAHNVSGVAGGLAGGIETSAGVVQVSNTALWGNSRGGVTDQAAQIRSFTVPPDVNHCVVQGLTGSLGGAGNLGADPLFVSAPTGDYRLSPGSPAIDAGSNPRTPAVTTSDVAGLARFIDDPAAPNTGVGPGPIVDIGAHERAPAVCPGDANGDGVVNFADLNLVLANFGLSAPPPATVPGDVNGDGVVNFADLNLVLGNFGAVC